MKVSSIRNNRESQSDTRLSWMMFHHIYHMYRDIMEQEREKSTELILNICANLTSKNTSFSPPIRPNISISEPKIPLNLKTLPEDLKET